MSDAKKEYKSTLLLPNTDFPMKAGLANREPQRLADWEENRLYGKILETRKDAQRFTLHDGPPYANGHIHLGHTLNKVLKDMIVKYKTMTGHLSDYIPGWDCHGLPIEWQVEKELGKKARETSKADKRRLCRAYAQKFIDIQREEFKRLGVLGRWEAPYLTMNFPYEAETVRAFAVAVRKGLVYRRKRPVYWDAIARTALAEAEIEYEDKKSPSIYVKFQLPDGVGDSIESAKDYKDKTYVIIWTTTPWTLPANLAISLHPEFAYVALKVGEEVWILADALVDAFLKDADVEGAEKLGTLPASALEGKKARHPWIDRDSVILLGEHVTAEAGTGCVHTAPGHGQDDYIIGLQHGLEVYSPVDDGGCFTDEVPEFAGQYVHNANDNVIALLEEKGRLVAAKTIVHQYPHSWRTKKPIIFRATDQWWMAIDGKLGDSTLRKTALEAIRKQVEWIPAYGEDRIGGMTETRPDWCLSRQRAWGVPIMAAYCNKCGHSNLNPGWIDHIADHVEKEGVDIWFEKPIAELLPEGAACEECGGTDFRPEEDILDVWFDSGVSHSAVTAQRGIGSDPEKPYFAEMYLEGSDQHRGWFNSALTTSAFMYQQAPYEKVLTHGFIVDGKGRKMSKSLGNVIDPQKMIKQYGADVLRLWISSVDYREDVRVSEEILKRMSEAYRRIRNTSRFLLGGLADFDPAQHKVPYGTLGSLDRYALHQLAALIDKATSAYEQYEFHKVYQLMHNFCSVDMSAFYLDIIKDRLYCDKIDDPKRRGAQTVMYEVLTAIAKIMAPVLVFTSEEIWAHRTKSDGDPDSVHCADWPKGQGEWKDAELEKQWRHFRILRGFVNEELEELRKEKSIGSSLDASIQICGINETSEQLLRNIDKEESLPAVLIVSNASLTPLDDSTPGEASQPQTDLGELGIRYVLAKDTGEKCARCWQYKPEVGQSPNGELCGRCHDVVKG